MPRQDLLLRDSSFIAGFCRMFNEAFSDMRIVTRSGIVTTNKMAFFGLLPSMKNLLCAECSHEEVVIIMPEEDNRNVQEAIKEMKEELLIDSIVKIFEGRSFPESHPDKETKKQLAENLASLLF